MIYLILEWTCTAIALAAFLYRLITVPGRRVDPALAALTVYFFGSFFSFIIGLDPVAPFAARLLGYRNIAVILSHGAVLLLTAAQLVVLRYWARPPAQAKREARRVVAGYAVATIALVTMFMALLPLERQSDSENLSLLNMGNDAYASYLVIYTIVIGVGQVVTLRASWAFARLTTGPWLRFSMRTVAVGAVLILGYCGMRILQVICVQTGVDISAWNPVQWLAGDIGSLLELVGWTAPGWGPAVTRAGRWLGDYQRYQRLRPLWVAMHLATPDIALDQPRSRLVELLTLRDLDYRLYRRVIEILDGQRALRPYVDARVDEAIRERVAAAGTEAGEPLVEALWLRAALRAKAEDHRVRSGPGVSVTARHPEDLAGEIDRLVAVAGEFQRSADLAATLPLGRAEQVRDGG